LTQFHNSSDEELWEAFRGNKDSYSNAAGEELYQRHFEALYRYGYHLVRERDVVEDCIQNLFVHLYQHRTTLGLARSVRFYLMASLRRRLAEYSSKAASTVELQEAHESVEVEESVEALIIEHDREDEVKSRLQQHIAQLPKRQREVLYLHFYQGLPHKHIAEVMGIEVETVYVFLHRAVAALRKSLHAPRR
jgi:RNA polymerase sigma-70 factor (ECF subfamily)